MLEGCFTERPGIVPSVPWPTSVGWCYPGPPGLARFRPQRLPSSARAHRPTPPKLLSAYELRRLVVTPAVEPAYLTSEAMDGAAQANPSEWRPGGQSCSARRLPSCGASVSLAAVGQASACHAGMRPIRLGATPYRLAGRSLRPSWASLTRMCLRCAIHGSAGHIRRLNGRGNPSPPRSRTGMTRTPPDAQQRTPRIDATVPAPARITSVI
jgi:hypothetical protein